MRYFSFDSAYASFGILSDAFVVIGGVSNVNGTTQSVRRAVTFFPQNQTWIDLQLDPSFPSSWDSVVTITTSNLLLSTNLAQSFSLSPGTTSVVAMPFKGAPDAAVTEACGDYFPDQEVALIYGGNSGNQCLNNLWEINLVNSSMEIITAANGPPSLVRSNAIRVNGNLYLFGGYACTTSSELHPMLNSIWSFTYASTKWSVVESNMPNVIMNPPVLLPSTGMVVFIDYFGLWYSFDAGAAAKSQFSDIIIPSRNTNPGPRYGASLFAQDEYVYVFGGTFETRNYPSDQENSITYGDMNLMTISSHDDSGNITLPIWLFAIAVAAGPALAIIFVIFCCICKRISQAKKRKERRRRKRLMRRQQEETEYDD